MRPVPEVIAEVLERSGWTRAELAAALDVDQSTAGRWTREITPTVDQIADIEYNLRLKPGTILIAAGYVEVEGAEAAILAAPDLEPDDRDALLRMYNAIRRPNTSSARHPK